MDIFWREGWVDGKKEWNGMERNDGREDMALNEWMKGGKQ